MRIEVNVHPFPSKLPHDVSLCVFRVAQEALRNVVRHARASVAAVTLASKDGGLLLTVNDNGQGFDTAPSEPSQPGACEHGGTDQSARRTAEHHEQSGLGTIVSAWVPLSDGFQHERGVKRARVLLADDHRLVAEGLKSLLEEEFELLAVVEDGRALVETAKRLRPDVIVADITMPHLNGIDALAQLKHDNPDVRVVFLTMHKEPAYARARWKPAPAAMSSSTRHKPSFSWRCTPRWRATCSSRRRLQEKCFAR